MNASKQEAQGLSTPRSAFERNFLLTCLTLTLVISFVDRQALTLLSQPIKLDLDLNDFQFGLLQGTAFVLLFCLAGLPVGWLVDQANRRNLVMWGIILWSIMTAACGLASSFAVLFFARMALGVGQSVLSPAAYSMLPDAFPPKRLVRALSIYTMAGAGGAGIALIAGGAAIGAISSMSSVPFGLKPWQATLLLVSTPGILIAPLFLLTHEPARKADAGERPPLRDTLSLLTRRRSDFIPLYICSLLLAVIAYGTFFWFPLHLVRAYRLPAESVGYILGSVVFLCAIGGAALGTILTEQMERRGYGAAPLRTVLIMSLLLIPASFASFVADFKWLLPLLILLVLGHSSFYGSLVAALQIITPPRMRGVNTSLFVMFTNLGSLGLGSMIIGAISDNFFAGRPDGLGVALTIVDFAMAAFSALIAWKSLPRFARIMNAALAVSH